jgi:hypothetical protein
LGEAIPTAGSNFEIRPFPFGCLGVKRGGGFSSRESGFFGDSSFEICLQVFKMAVIMETEREESYGEKCNKLGHCFYA